MENLKVKNYKDIVKITDNDVFIGRPSKWGNPFIIGKDGNRKDVIEKYKVWFWKQENLIKDIVELKGKNLICYCSPMACHGDFLLEISNSIICELIGDL